MDSSRRERGLMLGGWAVAGVLSLAVLLSVIDFPGGADEPERLVAAPPRATAVSAVEGTVRTPATRPERTPTAPAPTPPPNPLAALASACDTLRSAPSWGPGDREWFLTNCLASASEDPTQVLQPSASVSGPPLVQPTAAPPTAISVDPTATPRSQPDGASVAVSMAVEWLRNEAPVAYDADAAGCSATSLGGAWVTTCNARLAGCTDQVACNRTIGLCVTLQPPSVTSARAC